METNSNVVKLTGKVVNIKKGDKADRLSIRVTRPRWAVRKGQGPFIDIRIFFFHEDATNLENIMLHDKVKVTAHLSAPRRERGNNVYWSQALIGDYIMLDETGGDDINYVFLSGKVEDIRDIPGKRNKGAGNKLLRLNAVNKEFNNHVSVMVMPGLLAGINVGDTVGITGRMVTWKKPQKTGNGHSAGTGDAAENDKPEKGVTGSGRIFSYRDGVIVTEIRKMDDDTE